MLLELNRSSGLSRRTKRNPPRAGTSSILLPKIGLPAVESIQRVMIRAEVFRQRMPADRPMQHPTQPGAVHNATVHAKPKDAPRKLIHHHHHPISTQGGGLAAKQIAAPQAVLCVAEKVSQEGPPEFNPGR